MGLSRRNFLVVTGVTFWTRSLLEPGQAYVHGVACPVPGEQAPCGTRGPLWVAWMHPPP